MTDDDRFRAAVMMMTTAIGVFRAQGYDSLELVEHIEKEVFTPGGELYKKDREKRCQS